MGKDKTPYIDKLYLDVIKQEFSNASDALVFRIAEWHQDQIAALTLAIKEANETINFQRQQILILDDQLLKAQKENSDLKKELNK